jgi:hypothetical protein
MRIKLTDVAEGSRLPAWRPPQVAQLTAEAKQVVTVVLSEEMKALSSTLTRSLSDISSIQDVLTQDDRLLIAWAGELAKAEGLDPSELPKLVADLSRYRVQELSGQRVDLTLENVRRPDVTAMLSLPSFSPREEAQARAILFGLATTRGTIDPTFVKALLEPDLRSADSVSLGFVQRMIAAMPPGRSDGVGELGAIYARRDARVALVNALEALALPVAKLGKPTPERVELGAVIVRDRAAQITPRSPLQLLTTTSRSDRLLLGMLYVSQTERRGDPRVVDEVARALVTLRSGVRPVVAPTAPPSSPLSSPIHLAAKAAVAYRSVAPPRPNSVPPPALRDLYTPATSQRPSAVEVAPFNLAQALGLSALVADAHTQAMRARRRRFARKRQDDEIRDAAAAQETPADTENDPSHLARTHARWRRLVRRRLSGR